LYTLLFVTHYMVQFINYCRSVEWCAVAHRKKFACCTLKKFFFLLPLFLQRMHIADV